MQALAGLQVVVLFVHGVCLMSIDIGCYLRCLIDFFSAIVMIFVVKECLKS